jgi:drug/metabolite transporter (DMT)-like permease
MVRLDQLHQLDRLGAWLLVFACLNTVLAYGAFAEALVHWEASRVSAVISTTPLITLGVMWFLGKSASGLVAPERLSTLSVTGAVFVVIGSMLAALGRKGAKDEPTVLE